MINKIPFATIKNELQIRQCTTPQYVSSFKNPDDDTDEIAIKIQNRAICLPISEKRKLSSSETSEIIQRIGHNFNLELLQLADISRAVRSYYFGELKLEDMPFVLAKEMNIDLTQAKEIAHIIIDKIINDTSQEKAYQDNLEKLNISEALKKYPELGEQLITGNRIKIKNFPEPARPSLKNWLADYAILMGRETHTAIERGNYLFQSENGKSLSSSDRQRLNYILKCLDENTPVSVNKSTQQIVFPQISENNAFSAPESTKPPIEPKSNIQTIQFSYPQKAGYQKPSPPVVIPKTEVKNVMGPNVVNLKE